MNDSHTDKQEIKPNSNRLNSLIWIGVLWIVVRLIAELDHISWRRSFASDAMILGAWPATFFLILSVFLSSHMYVRHLRWAAFVSTVGSLTSLSFFEKQSDGMAFLEIAQQSFAAMVVTAIFVDWILGRGK